jgi:hypothetical protein
MLYLYIIFQWIKPILFTKYCEARVKSNHFSSKKKGDISSISAAIQVKVGRSKLNLKYVVQFFLLYKMVKKVLKKWYDRGEKRLAMLVKK